MKGIDLLRIYLKKDKIISIGRLGRISFKKGYYVYVGSAMNNLERRIERHKSSKKKVHWHIDYFLRYGKIIGVKKIITDKRAECKMSNKIMKMSDSMS